MPVALLSSREEGGSMRHARQGSVPARQESAQEGKRPVPTTDTLPAKETSDSRKENAVEYATLGNTGLLVSKLCFGTMTFGDGRGLFKAISTVGQAGADELIKTSIDGGILHRR
jgi:hypothetical protein